MRVDIEEVLRIDKERIAINKHHFDDIEFYKDGERINIPAEILKEWKYVGLNNMEFITCGFYEGE